MATTMLCGFEMQSKGETLGNTTATFSTSVFRSGLCSMRCNPAANSALVVFQKRPTGGTLIAFAQSFSFYIRIDVLTNTDNTELLIAGAATGVYLALNINGTIAIADGAGAGSATSTNAFTADALWHRIDVDCSGSTRTVYVDGVQWAQSTGRSTAAAQTGFNIGIGTITTCDIYFDDLRVDDGSIGAPAVGANNKLILLLPTAGNNAGGWTDGAGGTGDIHGSVDNIPPVGVLAGTAAAKINNATSTTTGDYVATMQTYLVGGVPANSKINAVHAIGSHGEEITTGNPKPGATWIASNPAQTAGTGTFDYGDNVIEGTYVIGWPTHIGPVSISPSVTLGTAPTVTVRKNLASTRVVACCFMGLYVDYSPPSIPDLKQTRQAVKRASYW